MAVQSGCLGPGAERCLRPLNTVTVADSASGPRGRPAVGPVCVLVGKAVWSPMPLQLAGPEGNSHCVLAFVAGAPGEPDGQPAGM